MKKCLLKAKEKIDYVIDAMNYHALAGATIVANCVMTFANEEGGKDIFAIAKSGADTIYSNVLKVDTPIAAVSIIVAMLISMFSHNQKVIDESRQVAKTIFVAWIVINVIGAIMLFGSKLVQGGNSSTDTAPTNGAS